MTFHLVAFEATFGITDFKEQVYLKDNIILLRN